MTVLQAFTIISFLCSLVSAGRFDHSSPSHPLNGASTRPGQLRRTLQSWMIRSNSKPKPRTTNTCKLVDDTGSIFRICRPTRERVAEWFGAEDDNDHLLRCTLRKEFNHDYVGMTNPFIHLQDVNDEEQKMLLNVQNHDLKLTIPASLNDSATRSWWPSLSSFPIHQKGWRVLTYRRQVGQGRECYERVRNAALDWEFQSEDGSLGMVAVPSSSFVEQKSRLASSSNVDYRSNYSVRATESKSSDEPMPYHRSIGSFRRMVTFSASKLPFLRNIYAVNPVMVVYDLVDQRSHDTTFTSTAYATMKGHLLRGEERVTVAFRDNSEAVDVEIVSVSKAGKSLKAQVIWPFIGRMQQSFFNKQLDGFERVARQDPPNL